MNFFDVLKKIFKLNKDDFSSQKVDDISLNNEYLTNLSICQLILNNVTYLPTDSFSKDFFSTFIDRKLTSHEVEMLFCFFKQLNIHSKFSYVVDTMCLSGVIDDKNFLFYDQGVRNDDKKQLFVLIDGLAMSLSGTGDITHDVANLGCPSNPFCYNETKIIDDIVVGYETQGFGEDTKNHFSLRFMEENDDRFASVCENFIRNNDNNCDFILPFISKTQKILFNKPYSIPNYSTMFNNKDNFFSQKQMSCMLKKNDYPKEFFSVSYDVRFMWGDVSRFFDGKKPYIIIFNELHTNGNSVSEKIFVLDYNGEYIVFNNLYEVSKRCTFDDVKNIMNSCGVSYEHSALFNKLLNDGVYLSPTFEHICTTYYGKSYKK